MKQSVDEAIKESRTHEMKIYLSSMKNMYESALAKNGEAYDIAAALTNNFRDITEDSILRDSRIIKILRYAIAPSISQMKFGQFFGASSIDGFENEKLLPGGSKYRSLKPIAGQIADFARKNIDAQRFAWLSDPEMDSPIALMYAKRWTCSIAADQNAQTNYRNWRKEQQEHAITAKLVELGYVKSSFRGPVEMQTDIGIGEYTKEIKIRAKTNVTHKADVAFRSKKSKKLCLIEAKAVGVEVDATKRTAECCNKAKDWISAKNLDKPLTLAIIGGFFSEKNLKMLQESGIRIVWEHRLTELEEFA